jgi:AraC-like DNA-binding protein
MSLYRYFKHSFNTTPKKYINSLRIEKARFLLQNKNQTVKDAAYRAGFTDPLYFSKVFKEKFGVSPSEYHNYYVNFMI